MLVTCHANSTFMICELDVLSKMIKLFKKRIKFRKLEAIDFEMSLTTEIKILT